MYKIQTERLWYNEAMVPISPWFFINYFVETIEVCINCNLQVFFEPLK